MIEDVPLRVLGIDGPTGRPRAPVTVADGVRPNNPSSGPVRRAMASPPATLPARAGESSSPRTPTPPCATPSARRAYSSVAV
jgi:hypothetical protein